MAFSLPVVGCLVKKGLQKGGHGHPRTPPGCTLDWCLPCLLGSQPMVDQGRLGSGVAFHPNPFPLFFAEFHVQHEVLFWMINKRGMH